MSDEQQLRNRICSYAARNGFAGASPERMQLLAMGGSDRRFYRVGSEGGACVAMVSTAGNDEQQAWLAIARLMHACGIAAPEIYAHDDPGGIVLVEDLGDASLYRALLNASDRREVSRLYRTGLELLLQLQSRLTPRMDECAFLRERTFDYAAFRGETDYFVRSFLRGYCEVEPPAALEREFHLLAGCLAAQPRLFMHRDFQSQNMIIQNDRIRIIDFQTATAGPVQYDLASFLKDAYFVLSAQERRELLLYYHEAAVRHGIDVAEYERFETLFHRAGLQRNMQALAAFAFLGTRKHKTHFLQHIPAALGYLDEALAGMGEFPCLRATVLHAAEKV